MTSIILPRPAEDVHVLPPPEPELPRVDLPMTVDVARHLKVLLGSNRGQIEQARKRMPLYLPRIIEIFDRHGVPRELINIGIIESRFDPSARSPAGAVGVWQFMRRTARAYGLKVDLLKDERKDVVRSSEGAAQYLADLYRTFNDWHLVIAAYNAGAPRIQRLMQETRSKDFWSLKDSGRLTKETADFVPRFIAVSLIMSDPERFGFEMNG